MEEFKERFGESVVDFSKVKSNIGTSFISTGSRALNLAITGHSEVGVVRRRIYEIYGPEGTGKTTIALEAIASCQRNGGKAMMVDAEHQLDPLYARYLGVKLHLLDLGESDTGEEAFEMVEWGINQGEDLIVVDSVSAMTPLAEIEGEMGDVHMGLQARMMGQGLRRLTSKLKGDVPTAIIFINQIRMKIGVVFGNPETRSGGFALKFFASITLDLRTPRAKKIVENKEEIGKVIIAKTIKNKIYPPFKKCNVFLTYGKGVDKGKDLIEALVQQGLAEGSSKRSTVKIKGYNQMNRETLVSKMKKDKEFSKKIKSMLNEKEV